MADIVTLDQVRDWLRIPATYTQDDNILSTILIPAATDVITVTCGDIIPKTYDEYYDGGDFSIWLRHKPVLRVEEIVEGWGFTNYTLDFVEVNASTTSDMFAYSIDMPNQGLISRRSGGNVNVPFMRGEGNVHIVYVCGRDIPASLVAAALQLISIWYRGFLQSQNASGSDTFATLEDQDAFSRSTAIATVNQGVPAHLLELIQKYRRAPIIG